MRLSNSLMRVAIIARSMSSTASATSASTVSPCADTSAKPPSTTIFCAPLVATLRPGILTVHGAWLASTPKSPSAPGTSTCSTSPENSNFSGETRSKWKVAIIYSASASAGREAYTKPDDAADQSDDGDVLNLAAGQRSVVMRDLVSLHFDAQRPQLDLSRLRPREIAGQCAN